VATPVIVWALIGLAAILASEVILRLPFARALHRVSDGSRKAARVLASKRVSDHWKEQVLPAYAWRIGSGSAAFLAMLIAVATPVVIVGLACPGGLVAWLEALMSPVAMLALCAVSVAYLWLRTRRRGG
jgi:hypothetical protein